MKEILELFTKPCIMGVIGNVNSGKSMLLYHLLETLAEKSKFDLFTYGLRLNFKNARQIYSVGEMEQITGSLIIIDELSSLWDLDNRKNRKLVENSLRLIAHNNNILVVCGTPENFKKFISAKLDYVFMKKITIADCINGSKMKNIIVSYKGNERGSEMLNLEVNQAILFDGKHFSGIEIPYYKKYDSKFDNKPIFVQKCAEMCRKSAEKVQKKCRKSAR